VLKSVHQVTAAQAEKPEIITPYPPDTIGLEPGFTKNYFGANNA